MSHAKPSVASAARRIALTAPALGLLIALAPLLAGCGQKGPLKLPAPAAPASAPAG